MLTNQNGSLHHAPTEEGADRPRPTYVAIARGARVRTVHPAHLHNLEKKGEFPKRIHLSPNRVVWDEQEVLDWIDAKKATREAA